MGPAGSTTSGTGLNGAVSFQPAPAGSTTSGTGLKCAVSFQPAPAGSTTSGTGLKGAVSFQPAPAGSNEWNGPEGRCELPASTSRFNNEWNGLNELNGPEGRCELLTKWFSFRSCLTPGCEADQSTVCKKSPVTNSNGSCDSIWQFVSVR